VISRSHDFDEATRNAADSRVELNAQMFENLAATIRKHGVVSGVFTVDRTDEVRDIHKYSINLTIDKNRHAA
jgi:hypothetical protein